MAVFGKLVAGMAALVLAASCCDGVRPSCSPVVSGTGYDFGDIEIDGGPVSCSFAIANDGTEPFSVISVIPSCGCVGVEVPSGEVMPGDSAFVKVTYTHDGLPSVFRHSVQVYLSSRTVPEMFCLSGTAHGSQRLLRKEFGSFRIGNLGLRGREFHSADVYMGFSVLHLETVANLGRKPLEVGFADVSQGFEVSVTPNPIPSRCTAELRFTIHSNPSVHGENTYSATPLLDGVPSGKSISVLTRTVE